MLFGVYVLFVKICNDNYWSSVSVKGQSVTKNDEHVFSTLKKYIWSDVTNYLCWNMHSLKTPVHVTESCIFFIVSSSVLHSGFFVTVQWRKLFLKIFISYTVWFFSHYGWGNFFIIWFNRHWISLSWVDWAHRVSWLVPCITLLVMI
jgi:hypothetical protein